MSQAEEGSRVAGAERQRTHLEILLRCADEMMLINEPQALYDYAARKGLEVSGAKFATINPYDPETNSVVSGCYAIAAGTPALRAQEVLRIDPRTWRASLDDPIVRETVLTKRLVRLQLYEIFFRQIPRPICRLVERMLGVRAIYSIGFWAEEDFLGGMTFFLAEEGIDTALVEAFARQVALALQKVNALEALRQDIRRREQAEEDLRRRNKETQGLYTIARAATRSTEISPEHLQMALEVAQLVTGVEAGAIYLRDISSGMLHPRAWRGPGGTTDDVRRGLGEGLAKEVAAKGETIISERSISDRAQDSLDARYPYQVGVPLMAGRQLLGVLILGSQQPGFLYHRVQTWVEALADQLALAMESANLYREVRQTAERYRSLFENSPIAVLLIQDGRCIDANPVAEQVFGLSREELLGHSPWDMSPPLQPNWADSAELGQEYVAKAQANGVQRFDWRYQYRDGKQIDAEVALAPLRIGGATLVQAFIRDVTEERLLARQLLQAQKMEALGMLSGGIAHDFNNILTAILGNVSFALSDLPPDSPVRHELGNIKESGEQAAQLTRQLLTFSRRQIPAMGPTDINDVVAKTARLLRRSIPESIEIRVNLDPSMPTIATDEGQLRQVLLNLAVNARDAMGGNGVLTLATEVINVDDAHVSAHPQSRVGTFSVISVTDTGCGMDEQVLAHIFEPFFTTKEEGKGTGLGLTIVQGIIGDHGGWIEVESQLGQGSTFRLYLPCVTTPAAPQEEEVVTIPQGTETILLIEDMATVTYVGQGILERCGYRVLTARDGEEALEVWREHTEEIALIITDLVMPRMGGQEFLKVLREQGAQVPVVLASGYAMGNDAQSGFAGFVPKPFRADTLARTVRSVLDEHQSLAK